jgi:hypothetical protein
MTYVDRVYSGGVTLQQAVGKPAGGCSNVERDLVRDIDVEVIERTLQFEAAAPNIF